jgi:hypothetical protein
VTLATRTIRGWLLPAFVNLTIAVTAIWKYHTGAAIRSVATVSAYTSIVTVNTILIIIIRTRHKKNGDAIPRGFILGAVGLGLLSALATSMGLHLISPP